MPPSYRGKEQLTGKTVIITGCNTGIGKETATDLARRGGRIIMACRSVDKAEAAKQEIVAETLNQNVIVKKLDVSSFRSIRAFCDDINRTEERLDILINNAGVSMTDYTKTEDGYELQMATNHFGPFLLTGLLLDKLKASAPSRILVMSSEAHGMNSEIDFDDVKYSEKGYAPFQGYCRSKLANMLYILELSKKLKGTGVTAYAVHPGLVDTGLTRHSIWHTCFCRCLCFPIRKCFWRTPKQGAQSSIYCALSPEIANDEASGKYYADNSEKRPHPRALNEADARRLWDISEEVTGIKY